MKRLKARHMSVLAARCYVPQTRPQNKWTFLAAVAMPFWRRKSMAPCKSPLDCTRCTGKRKHARLASNADRYLRHACARRSGCLQKRARMKAQNEALPALQRCAEGNQRCAAACICATSSSARLQSIMGDPVLSRSSFTVCADMLGFEKLRA